MSFLVSAGPCLIMAMGVLAFAVVNLGLSRAHHALFWAVASALGAAEWGLLASQGGAPASMPIGLFVRLTGIGSALFLVLGLLVRRDGRLPHRGILAVGAAVLVGASLAGLLPAVSLRAAIVPGLSVLLILWAVRLVVGTAGPPSATEAVVVAVMLALVLVDLLTVGLAVGEWTGLLAPRGAFVTVFIVSAEPASAALVLALIMLIAYDYAVELRRLLHTDPLTGVLNRQGFEHAAKLLLDRGRSRRMAMAVADIDRFKQVNDVHGHAVGDATLAGVATRLAEHLGRDGVVARIGGEEFAILLPGLDAAAAFERVEALRHGLETATVEAEPALRVTASFGVAERATGEALDALMERADAALYRSKREGRNRASLADASPA